MRIRYPLSATASAIGLCWTLFLPLSHTRAQEPPEPQPPTIVEASGEAALALSGFRIQAGIEGKLFAAEPLFANPVAIYVDGKGRVFVCETFRQENGVVDNRDFSDVWVDADLAAQSIEDRRDYFVEQLGPRLDSFMEQDDQIRILLDEDQDGVADASHVFANKFNGLLDGTGAGILEYKGNVYYTCIPSLYLMRDENDDFVADGRTVLHTGYGVRVAFRGHDLHGLVIGPDGRLYFSIGDRGANVDTPDGKLINVESGSVFRCELDGSQLELYATGLRNPQELAFDDMGNLFTGDNNSDSGDKARWVHVVEGGDSGWRMAYQYLADRGPFNREKLWEPLHAGQPAYIIPPIANISDGPSGLGYYPGTGFGDLFEDQFLLADFRGTANQSGIRSLRNEPDGAFFKLAEDGQPLWNMLATDVQFGPDGAIYVCDWVNGWEGEGKGRIYRFFSKTAKDDPLVAEVRRLLATNFSELEVADLSQYLGHADRRIRQNAQLELASRRELRALMTAAKQGETLHERLHGLWGMDHLARLHPAAQGDVRDCMLSLVNDPAPEIRAHVTRLLGELGGTGAAAAIRAKLTDESPRVRYFAMISAGKLADAESFEPVVAIVAENAGRDPIVRHGGYMALAHIASTDQLTELAKHPSLDVRLAAVVALRRLASPLVSKFLDNDQELVVVEAARAIHDVPIPAALPQLAAIIETASEDDALLRRVLNANFRLGTRQHAAALAKFASSGAAPESPRIEAIRMLGTWGEPGNRDRVLGMWRPLDSRSAEDAAAALRPVIASFANADSSVRLEVGRIAGKLKIAEAAPVLKALIADEELESRQRAEALVSLVELGDPGLGKIVEDALSDSDATLRAAALGVVRQVLPEHAEQKLTQAALSGETLERQTAIAALGSMPVANEGLMMVLNHWADGSLPPELHLEALTAAEQLSGDAKVAEILAKVNATRDPSKPIDLFRETMHGGNAARGRDIFSNKVSVSCVRCHKVALTGGEVGPELTRIAVDKNREYLLESIVDPNKAIAKGFESAMLLDLDGQVHTGVVRNETDDEITLIDAEAKVTTFKKDEIDSRAPSKSAMPEDMVKNLTKAELRDLVEYLSTLDGQFRFRRRTVQ